MQQLLDRNAVIITAVGEAIGIAELEVSILFVEGFNIVLNVLQELFDFLLAVKIFGYHDKFVATEAAYELFIRYSFSQQGSEGVNHAVAHIMS